MIAILTEKKAQELMGKQLDEATYYNPIQLNGVWVISEQEVLRSDIDWVKELALSEIIQEPLNNNI